jgi:hypothetical protein
MDIRVKHVAAAIGVAAGIGAAAAGVRFALGIETAVSQGGSPWGGSINWFLARRHVIGYGVRDIAFGGSPLEIRTRFGNNMNAKRAEETVRTMENVIFYGGARQVGTKLHIGYDNGPDAFRHTGGSALMVYRMRHGDSPISTQVLDYFVDVSNGRAQLGRDAAQLGDVTAPRGRAMGAHESDRLFDGLAHAHEKDSRLAAYDRIHDRFSSEQDVHNNELGRLIGIEAAAQHATMGADEIARQAQQELRGLPSGIVDALRALDPGEQVVMARTIRAIEEGRAVSMTPLPGVAYVDEITGPGQRKGIHQQPHPTLPTDIYDIAPDGTRSVRMMPPHAAGFPQPFRDGRYDPTMPRVPADLRMLLST